MTFRGQLLALQTLVMLVVVLGAGATAAWVQERIIREAYVDRMIAVAQSVAQLPTVRDALDDDDPSLVIQPIAELTREASDVTYVVVSDANGIRASHPNAELIGQRVSTEPDAILSGEMFVGTQTGTLGESWRVKVPIFADDGAIMGQVSVGTLESQLHGEFIESLWWLVGAVGVAAIVGVVLNTWIANYMRGRIYGLEPAEIKEMLETREATLHGIAEGIIVTDESSDITLVNDAALAMLGHEDEAGLVGRQLASVLDIDPTIADQQLAFVGERILLVRSDSVEVRGSRVGNAIILVDQTDLETALRDLHGAQTTNDSLRAQQHEFANTLHTIHGLIELDETESALRVVERAGFGGALGDADAHHGIRDLEVAALLLGKRARAKELGVDFALAEESTLPAAGADEGAARVTVLGNLIDNALDAAGAGGHVRVALAEGDDAVRMTVDDSGPGIDAADRERIFELRYSSKAAVGTTRGYGLALVRRLLTHAGGSIAVEDSALGGARFTVEMPLGFEASAGERAVQGEKAVPGERAQ